MSGDLAAIAPFYGGNPMLADVAKIKAAVLMHHGGLDMNLVKAYPAYEAELKKNNIPHEVHIWQNSVHGFFNDATPERYNKVTAPQAWARTIEWFNPICPNCVLDRTLKWEDRELLSSYR